MHSKNKAPMTATERQHVTEIKLMPCSVCGTGGGEYAPSETHEIEQCAWFTSIPLCADCHRGPLGLHGTKAHLKVRKLDELKCLNLTIERLMYGRR